MHVCAYCASRRAATDSVLLMSNYLQTISHANADTHLPVTHLAQTAKVANMSSKKHMNEVMTKTQQQSHKRQ